MAELAVGPTAGFRANPHQPEVQALLEAAVTLTRRWRERRKEPVVDPVGPVGCCDNDDQLDDLFTGQVLAEAVEVRFLDVPWPTVEEVGKSEHCPLFEGEDVFSQSPPRILQRRDLFLRDAPPLPRSGVSSRSIGAAIQDGDPQVSEFLDLG